VEEELKKEEQMSLRKDTEELSYSLNNIPQKVKSIIGY
jgi:hypothetical protein